jgi:HemX protein
MPRGARAVRLGRVIAIAHFVAISCYLGAVAFAAAPFARPVSAPVRAVAAALALAVLAHGSGLAVLGFGLGQLPVSGLGPALSFAGLALGITLLVVELLAREVSLTLAAAPLAAVCATAAVVVGFEPVTQPTGVRGFWLDSHIALSFLGIAAFATSAAAGAMYLVERRELKSRRFGPVFRFFPPLETLDRVNHFAAVVGMLGLTLGVVLAATYSLEYHTAGLPKVAWAVAAWLGATVVAVGRLAGGWRARRAALVTTTAFIAVVLFYLAVRVAAPDAGRFL